MNHARVIDLFSTDLLKGEYQTQNHCRHCHCGAGTVIVIAIAVDTVAIATDVVSW